MTKTRITLAIDKDARQLIDQYAGKRGIGCFFADLVRKHHFEDIYGEEMLKRRLDRIEDRLVHLVENKA